MTTVIIEKINTNKLQVIGKTHDSVSYSGDVNSREKVSRAFITLEDVEKDMTVRGEGKDTTIVKVEAADKLEVGVQLLGAENLADGASLAKAILKDVWTAQGKELPEVFVMEGTNCEALDDILSIANLMKGTETGRRALGKWYPTVDGKRVLIRTVKAIDKKGNIDFDATPDCEAADDADCDQF